MNPEKTPQEPQPVAYDASGRPLYAHPPVVQTNVPPVVHVARAVTPEKQVISPEVKKLHDRSVAIYPTLHLSEGEFVVRSVRRHPIGLILPLGIGVLMISAVLTLLSSYDQFATMFNITGFMGSAENMVLPLLAFTGFIALGMFISYYVYTRNTFFLTNESVIQEIQHSLFSRHEQTVSLGSIEDASYTQKGIFQNVLNYGDIRLSTEGEETTYHFTYVMSPRNHIAVLNDAVEAFKNGRPVGD